MFWTYIGLVGVCTFVVMAGVIGSIWLLRGREPLPLPDELPFVSVVKPLKGVAYEALRDNLETFAKQTYPNYELLFGVVGEDDPVIPLVEAFMADHPDVSCRLVVHDGNYGFHPKIANIRGVEASGVHDLLVCVDADIAVPPDYIEQMVAQISSGTGLASNLYIATEEQNLAALFENLQINGTLLNQLCIFRTLFRETLIVGKTMSFSKKEFDRLGGFESISYVLAEDYLTGKKFKRAGHRMDFASPIIEMVNRHSTFEGMWRRYHRWSIQRSHVAPMLYPFELFTMPLLLALFAPLFGVSLLWSLAWGAGLVVIRDLVQWTVVRGVKKLPLILLIGIPRELYYITQWVAAPFFHYVDWKGQRLHIGEGTHLFIKGNKK